MGIADHELRFRQWLSEHSGLLLKVVRSFAEGPDQDDLFQEILLQVWLSLPSFREDSKPTTWLYRVALNTALAWKRSEKKRRRRQSSLPIVDPAAQMTTSVDAERNSKVVDQLYAAIRALPPAKRALVVLYLDGFTYREISEVVGISESNVGVSLNRIKRELAAAVKEPAMDPEKLRQAWQSQPGGSQIHIDADVLFREVRRNQQSFRATIFWRDFREIFAALIVGVFVSLQVVLKGFKANWPWLLMGVGAAFVAAYILLDRRRQRSNAPHYEGALISNIEQSLKDVDHQIWLLRKVVWWYLLPVALGIFVPNIYFFARDLATRELHTFLGPFVVRNCILIAIFYGVYLLNQSAVRRGLEPRRRELLAMRQSLLNTENESRD